jgi:uncharacterized protein (UPF0332 family)
MTTDQKLLLDKARDSLEAARLLAADEFYDFSASRAYYAMFYVAEAFLLEKGQTFSKHSAVIAAFGQQFAKPAALPARFHQYLIQADQARNVGDYDIGPGLTQAQAAEQIARAEEFIQLAEKQLNPRDS